MVENDEEPVKEQPTIGKNIIDHYLNGCREEDRHNNFYFPSSWTNASCGYEGDEDGDDHGVIRTIGEWDLTNKFDVEKYGWLLKRRTISASVSFIMAWKIMAHASNTAQCTEVRNSS